jgi:integration host factor subunit beta
MHPVKIQRFPPMDSCVESGQSAGGSRLADHFRGGTMTKSDLIRQLAEERNISKGRAEALVNRIFDSIEEALRRGERVEIRGIGSFEIRHYGAYKGRNPRTGDAVAVKPKRLPFFKVGKQLRDLINAQLTRTQDLPRFEEPALHIVPKAEPRSA